MMSEGRWVDRSIAGPRRRVGGSSGLLLGSLGSEPARGLVGDLQRAISSIAVEALSEH